MTLPEAYELFEQSFRALAAFRLLAYTDAADKLVEAFGKGKLRVGTRDLRIAAICMVHGATLVTRKRPRLQPSARLDPGRVELTTSQPRLPI